jgi:hypothetical protein
MENRSLRRYDSPVPTNIPNRSFAAILILAGAQAAGPIDFPLSVNTKWTYHLRQELGEGVHFGEEDAKLAKGNVLEATIFSTVKAHETINGAKYARVASVRENGRPYVTEWYSVGPAGLLLGKTIDDNGAEIMMLPPQKLLTPTLAPGETWTWKDRNNPVSMNIRVGARSALQTPAGKFTAQELSHDMTIEMQGASVRVLQKRWFVPSIGYVKQDTETSVGTRAISHVTLTLEKFESAK